MKFTVIRFVAAAALFTLPSICQDTVPVYRVTVIQSTLDSVSFQPNSGPAKIDFRGTVLLPAAKGDATVDPQKGHTAIDAKFDGLRAPQRFGNEYLSYVLWAVTPDGRAHNLGEIVPNGSDHAHLPVTTDLQAFGLMVTAEPYAAVRHPSDLIVLENQIRPDTIGDRLPVKVKVELMPRGQYTWNVPASESAEVANAPKVSMSRYQAMLEVYEAQNALGIARTAGAEKYDPDVYAKAQQEFQQAEQLQASKGGDDLVVQHARAATEIAEDARIIADRRQQDEALIAARQRTLQAQEAAEQAQAMAQKEHELAQSAQVQAQVDHDARLRAEQDAQAARERELAASAAAQIAPPPVVVEVVPSDLPAAVKERRAQLFQRMNSFMVTRDTPRGLDATLEDNEFNGSQLRPGPASALAQLAGVLISHPGLHISVEGSSDTPNGAALAGERAQAAAAALMRAGVPARQISSESIGNSRLIVSNATEQGRMENRRVEILISGDSIGTVPVWDHSYSLSFNSNR
jgi:flagellar motor protein MotB